MRTIACVKRIKSTDVGKNVPYLVYHPGLNSIQFVPELRFMSSVAMFKSIVELGGRFAPVYSYTEEVKWQWWNPYVAINFETRWFQNCRNNMGIYKEVDPERIAPWALEELVGVVFDRRTKLPVVGYGQ